MRCLKTTSVVVWLLVLLVAPQVVHAQDRGASLVSEEIGRRLEVSLVTVEPGPYYWQRYGHNAILLEDSVTGYSGLYNYGVFDFNRPGFLVDFLRGRMQYRLLTLNADRDLQRYLDDSRLIRIQKLNLTPAQTLRLARFLEWNRLPENTEYQYDYFFDNCSTRVRDALDLALDGQLRSYLQSLPATQTMRQHAERFSSSDWWAYAAVKVGLGRPVDRPIDRWAESFIPMVLRDSIVDMSTANVDGEWPLVSSSDELRPVKIVVAPVGPPIVWPYWLVAGLVIAGLVFAFRLRVGRAYDRLVGMLAVELGVIGLLLTLLWFGTDHEGAYTNENVLVFSPLLIVIGIGVLRSWSGQVLRAVLTLVGASTLLALLIKFMPFSQGNIAVLALMIPVNLSLIFALWNRRERSV